MIALSYRSLRLALMASVPALLLAACGSGGEAGSEDSGAAGGLGDEIMVDPDLAGVNGANGAAAIGDGSAVLPESARSPQALAKARSEALKLTGGPGSIKKAPAARVVNGTLPPEATLSAAARAAATPGNNVDCAKLSAYSMGWADRLPATFPVYPMGAVQEAAGTDEAGCTLRVVNFVTALPTDEVIDFYYTRAASAGYSTQRVREAKDDVLGGTKGTSSYVIYVRALAAGGSEVDLVTNGR